MSSADRKQGIRKPESPRTPSNAHSLSLQSTTSSAASMHSLQDYPDPYSDNTNDEDLPPYTDDIPEPPQIEPQSLTASPSHALLNTTHHPSSTLSQIALSNTVPSSRSISYRTPRLQNPFARNRGTAQETLSVTLHPDLSIIADALHLLVVKHASLPPEPYVYIKGTHERRSRDPQGKESRDTIVDFEFQVQGRDTICRGSEERLFDDIPGQPPQEPLKRRPYWRKLILPRATSKVYRGTRTKVQATAFKGSDAADLEGMPAALQGILSESPDQEKALQYWVDRFITDPAAVKSFSFRRKLEGFDSVRVQNAVSAHIRSLNYRGSISVETRVCNAGFLVYSPHWINRLRTNSFVWYLIVILQLWIITWPVIWVLEKRYEVATCHWYFSKGAGGVRDLAMGYDEEGWVRLWGKAIQSAAESRRKNAEWLIYEDLVLANERRDEEHPARQQAVQSGQGGWVGSAIGLARGLSEVNREYNRAAGWGMDE